MDILFLADLTVLRPELGTIVWTSLIFLFVYFMLSRFAFKPIQSALKERNEDIQASLDEAKKAREEMDHLVAKNEELLIEAREERNMIIREAHAHQDKIISEAREKAKEEFRRIVEEAKEQIDNQRMAAVVDLKNQVGTMAIDIAEKVLRRNLDSHAEQERYVQDLVDEINLK